MSEIHISDIFIPLVNYIPLIKYHESPYDIVQHVRKGRKCIMKEPDAVLRLSIRLIPEFPGGNRKES